MSGRPAFDTLAAAEEILAALRARHQQLLLREAKQGYETPPSVLTEIDDYNGRVRAQEAEVARLQTEGAVDRFSFAEAEYRETVARVWGTERGEPTVAGEAALEVLRLRLGVSHERADVLAREIRVKLAIEVLDTITTIHFQTGTFWHAETCLKTIGRAVRLDMKVAAELIAIRTVNQPPTPRKVDQPFQLIGFRNRLLRFNSVWPDSEEQKLFNMFLEELESELRARGVEIEGESSGPPEVVLE